MTDIRGQITRKLRYNTNTGVFTWLVGRRRGKVAGTLMSNGYMYVNIRLGTCPEDRIFGALSHRLAFLYMEGYLPEEVDHINGNRMDNRWRNLRDVTHSENMLSYHKINLQVAVPPHIVVPLAGLTPVSFLPGAKHEDLQNKAQRDVGTNP